MKNGFSRRGFLKGLGIGVGAAIGARLPGSSFIGEAKAATPKPTTLFVIHFVGGMNAIFASADSLNGRFGVAAGNQANIGNGLVIDKTFADGLPAIAKQKMAAVGVRHQISSHPNARRAMWTSGSNSNNAGLVLASAIGGTASIKAAVVGGNLIADAPGGTVNGVSFQAITDMQKTIDALGGGVANPRVPDRTVALAGMTAAQAMSGNALAGSPESLESVANGYTAAVDTLKQPVKQFDIGDLRTAYQLGANQTAVNSFRAKLAAAELMARAGTNVVAAFDGGWDTHGDTQGTTVRNKMTQYVLAPLNTFLSRMLADTSRNVMVALIGDFARSLPGSDHQPNLSALVFGNNVKVGTTGKTLNNSVALPAGTPSTQGFWSLLSGLAKTDTQPFGAPQHGGLILA